MKKIGFATVVTSGLAAAIFGLAALAQAVAAADAPTVLPAATDISTGIDHHAWLDDIRPNVNVPQVDTSVRTRTKPRGMVPIMIDPSGALRAETRSPFGSRQ